MGGCNGACFASDSVTWEGTLGSGGTKEGIYEELIDVGCFAEINNGWFTEKIVRCGSDIIRHQL